MNVLVVDGSIDWILCPARCICAEAGREPVPMRGAVIDDTECKQAEEERQQQAARWRTLAEILSALAKSGLDVQAALDTIARQTAETIGDFCAVQLLSEDRNWPQQATYHHHSRETKALMAAAFLGDAMPVVAYAVVGDAMRTGQGRLMPEANEAELKQAWSPEQVRLLEQTGIRSLVLVSLVSSQ